MGAWYDDSDSDNDNDHGHGNGNDHDNGNGNGNNAYEHDYSDYLDYSDDDKIWRMSLAVTILPQVTSLFSLIGSYIILREVKEDHGRRRGRTISRILMGLSVSDILFSISCFMSTWASPKEEQAQAQGDGDGDALGSNMNMNFNTNFNTNFNFNSNFNSNSNFIGTTATCEVQGFLQQLGLFASPLFNVSLSFFYLLIVRFNWTDRRLANIEPIIHALIWPVSLGTAILPLPLEMYNNAEAGERCWIASYPKDCLDSFSHGETTCTRGDNAWIAAVTFTIFPIWPSIGFSVGCMILMYLSVYELESRNLQYTHGFMASNSSSNTNTNTTNTTNTNTTNTTNTTNDDSSSTQMYYTSLKKKQKKASRRRSRLVALQGLRYTTAFLATHSCWTISSMRCYTTGGRNATFDLIAYAILLPLQGFFNSLVFVRTRTMLTPEGKLFRKFFCFCSSTTTTTSTTTTPRRKNAGVVMMMRHGVSESISMDFNDDNDNDDNDDNDNDNDDDNDDDDDDDDDDDGYDNLGLQTSVATTVLAEESLPFSLVSAGSPRNSRSDSIPHESLLGYFQREDSEKDNKDNKDNIEIGIGIGIGLKTRLSDQL